MEDDVQKLLEKRFPDIDPEDFHAMIEMRKKQTGGKEDLREFFSRFKKEDQLLEWMFGSLSVEPGPYQQMMRKEQLKKI